MTELEKIEYAKTFIDKLANGINPLDDTPIPDGDIANNVRLSRCFFYVSDILRQVVENGGLEAPKATKKSKKDFTMTEEEREMIQLSSKPLSVTEISNHLNSLVNTETTKKISATTINDWLVLLELLKVVEQANGKTRKVPTEQGREIGIFTEERTGQYGTYVTVLYNMSAQQFIYDNIESIIEFKSEKDDPLSEFHNRPWTESHDKQLIDLYNENISIVEMAKTLKRTNTGIRSRLNKLGLI